MKFVAFFELFGDDRISILLTISDSYLEWLLAVAYIGGIIAPLNYRWVRIMFYSFL